MTTDIPALLKVALEALEPFETYANEWHPMEPDTTVVVELVDDVEAGDIELSLGDFRRARKAATALREAMSENGEPHPPTRNPQSSPPRVRGGAR
jgi:hypothetical protein